MDGQVAEPTPGHIRQQKRPPDESPMDNAAWAYREPPVYDSFSVVLVPQGIRKIRPLRCRRRRGGVAP
jgi:hypothetical protein